MNYKSLILAVPLLLLSACGGSSGSKSISYIPFSSEDKLTEVSPEVSIDSSFQHGMGMLLIKKDGKLGLCTSFLITPNHLLTNSHCITEISEHEDCSGLIAAHIKTPGSKEYRSCKKIVKKSNLIAGSFSSPDYAVIEISSPVTSVKPMELSREGIFEHSELTVESVDFSQDWNGTVIGKRKISKCAPHTNSLLGNYTHKMSSIIPLFGESAFSNPCKIIPGNSGSPVFNSDKKVVSVVFAALDRNKLSAISPSSSSSVRDMALATNISCLKIGISALDNDLSPECEAHLKDEAQYMQRIQAKIDADTEKVKGLKIEHFKKLLPSTFEFNMTEKKLSSTKGERFLYVFTPKCMKSRDQWSEEEKLLIKTSGKIFKKYSYRTYVPSFSQVLATEFDEFLRPKITTNVENTSGSHLVIEDLEQVKDGKITTHLVSFVYGREYKMPFTVPVCE